MVSDDDYFVASFEEREGCEAANVSCPTMKISMVSEIMRLSLAYPVRRIVGVLEAIVASCLEQILSTV